MSTTRGRMRGVVLCTSRADSSQARVSWHPALGGLNRGRRADSSPLATRAGSDRGRLEPLGGFLAVSWRFLGGSSLGLGSARASSPGVPCAEPAREQHY